jgi:hypothetical protein
MPYDANDPRSQLAQAAGNVAGVPRSATYAGLDDAREAELGDNGSRTWWTRGDAAVIGYTAASVGDELAVDVEAEYAIIVIEGATVTVEHDGDTTPVDEAAVVVVPPGASTVRITAPGTVVRVFAAATAPDLAARAANADDYAGGDPNVAEFVPWPDPPEGHRVRVYPLGDYAFEEGRLGKIFRCSTSMINVFAEDGRPRDATKLSPHHHDDFEQVSLQVAGDYVHHMRVPWTPDSSTWRDDEHQHCVAPSVVVIPPPIIHTSQSVGTMRHLLIDVFVPPRHDFSARPGWVLNARDYPVP